MILDVPKEYNKQAHSEEASRRVFADRKIDRQTDNIIYESSFWSFKEKYVKILNTRNIWSHSVVSVSVNLAYHLLYQMCCAPVWSPVSCQTENICRQSPVSVLCPLSWYDPISHWATTKHLPVNTHQHHTTTQYFKRKDQKYFYQWLGSIVINWNNDLMKLLLFYI